MINDIDLMKLVIEVDDELITKGIKPFQRSFHANIKIGERLQLGCRDILNDELSIRVRQIYGELYRPTDLHMPLTHTGVFMFRDMFFSLHVSIIFGLRTIESIEFLDDITEKQREWLFANPESSLKFFDQAIDLMDFVYGLGDVLGEKNLPDKTLIWWHKAKQQLEAAAATLLSANDKGAVIQNCCIATELLLKGALMATIDGITEDILANKTKDKSYGHALKNLVNKTAEQLPTFDKETVLFAINQLPNYVESRYGAEEFSRLELGDFVMNTQFIGGEVLRQFSERNFRANLISANGNLDFKRTFPKSN